MFKLRLKPSPKKGDYYSYHNGYEYVRFTCARKYAKSLSHHRDFLQQIVKHKKLQLMDSLLEKDLDSIERIVNELKRAKILNSCNPYEVRRLNFILIGYCDQWDTKYELWDSEINSMTIDERTARLDYLSKKRFKKRLQKIVEKRERRKTAS